jgi:hypothetical protein
MVVLSICRLRDQVELGPEGVAGVLGRPFGEDRRRRPSEARLVFSGRVAQVHRHEPRLDLMASGQIDRTTITGLNLSPRRMAGHAPKPVQ